jgi:hypothetical protein
MHACIHTYIHMCNFNFIFYSVKGLINLMPVMLTPYKTAAPTKKNFMRK